MKRLAVLLILILPSHFVAGLAFAEPGLTARAPSRFRVESLVAQWIIPTKVEGKFDYIVVRAMRRTNLDTNKVRLFGSAGVGDCSSYRDGAVGCGTELYSHRVVKFQIDADFRSAKIVMRRGSKRHSVTWEGGNPYAFVPPVTVNSETCPNDSEGTLTEIYLLGRSATAEGRVFGRPVSTSAEPEEHREQEDMSQALESRDCP